MAEYIEREALMKFPIRRDHCDKEHANEHFICGIETVLEYAESLPTADVAPVVHWNPADEKLPPEGQEVLCWYEFFHFVLSYNRMSRTYGIGYQYNGMWDIEAAQGRDAKVLAWMPLPEPPKMDGGDNDAAD